MTETGQNEFKEENEVKPGLYYIFEVQEEQELPEPVDAPIDRTDIENLVEPDTSSSETDSNDSAQDQARVLLKQVSPESKIGDLSEPTRQAYVGSALLFAQCLINRKNNSAKPVNYFVPGKSKLFSRASRLARKNIKPK